MVSDDGISRDSTLSRRSTESSSDQHSNYEIQIPSTLSGSVSLDTRNRCKKCSKFLSEVSSSKHFQTQTCLGTFDDYNDPECLLCHVISCSVRLLIGSSKGKIDQKEIKLFAMGKRRPAKSSGSRQLKISGHRPRILLALNVAPSDQGFVISNGTRFSVAELEDVSPLYAPKPNSESNPEACSRRVIPPQMDLGLINQWMQVCNAHKHSDKISSTDGHDPFQHAQGFRLIDVVDECLVQKTDRCSYLALSYVWGTTIDSMLKTIRSNIRALRKPGALKNQDSIPRTIRDAMCLVRSIGQRYLWVDALCIVQDDPEEKKRLICGMDYVYENAMLTIIAASGGDADAGLSGITHRQDQAYEETAIFQVKKSILRVSTYRPSLTEHLQSSRWNTRGWTYQEQYLSKRLLYFTPDEAFFVCRSCRFREGYCLEDLDRTFSSGQGRPRWSSRLRSRASSGKDVESHHYLSTDLELGTVAVRECQSVILEYSNRVLSDPEDILNAFSGVYNHLSSISGASPLSIPGGVRLDTTITFTQGIPPWFISQGLLWHPANGTTKRRSACKDDSDAVYSSWSWTSWNGPIEFLSNVSFWPWQNDEGPYLHVHSWIPEWHFAGFSVGGVINNRNDLKAPRNSPRSKYIPKGAARLAQEAKKSIPPTVTLASGDLGFWAPCLSFEFSLYKETKCPAAVWNLSPTSISDQWCGSFRFDDGIVKPVEDFVLLSRRGCDFLILGIDTQNGVSTRVGIGLVCFQGESRDSHSNFWDQLDAAGELKWEWRFIVLR
ncbi:uncharacterized protein K452DRAFT_292284 [Aplosporella prunicola CBS 121167]|uniref:Heterokaryon incompatibility domain-containing protein n=1 Tax=Aplosporella prunicola CBS 121167 TaxID=1176127 RepID=A0A6A6AXR2_9PEZI|nr:uncharacterized protein K452DRAFT_292284 [Aplosporella prunicola CBS 121167]KAF2136560.1 hypothetical protein K452DRAFT_292284 [Aplosporella prunicola CBS 121167]